MNKKIEKKLFYPSANSVYRVVNDGLTAQVNHAVTVEDIWCFEKKAIASLIRDLMILAEFYCSFIPLCMVLFKINFVNLHLVREKLIKL